MRAVGVGIAALLVAAGLTLPAAASSLDSRSPGIVGMDHEGYEISGVPNSYQGPDGIPVITIHRGQTLTFQNDSRWVHVVGPGEEGLLSPVGEGAMAPMKMMEENAVYTTPPWMTPGTYLLTCTVHPEMNAKVVVLD
jgi:plastocyanin